jgi:hypothetical protein
MDISTGEAARAPVSRSVTTAADPPPGLTKV